MKAAFVALVLLVGAGSLAVADEEPTKFKITTKRDNDTVEVRAEKDKTVFSVKSPFGISQAVIERTDEKWPDAVVLRLHLKGLENFRASNGKVTLEASVSSPTGQAARCGCGRTARKTRRWTTKSPFWMDIRIVAGDGKPAKEIPLKDGYFEMALPKAFFEGNPKSITVNWIDFYRN